MQRQYLELEAIFKKALTLRSVASLLRWDAEVMMPRQSHLLRAEQLTVVNTLVQDIVLSAKTARLLKTEPPPPESLDAWQSKNLELMHRQYKRLHAIPASLIQKLDKCIRTADAAWADAKKAGDYSIFEPAFSQLLRVVKEKAQRLSDCLSVAPFEALMDEHDPKRKQSEVDALLNETKQLFPQIIFLAQKNAAQTCIPFEGKFSKKKQNALCHELLRLLHFPLKQGRLDESVHPFTEGVAQDIRITTIFDRFNPLNTIMGLMHELGHALYDCALPSLYRFQLVGQDAGMVVHEGMALFWEKMVGSSAIFTPWLAQHLQHHFGPSEQWSADNIYAHLTAVDPEKIRIEADEVSYMGHIILRYEVEKALFSDDLQAKDIPQFWQEQTKAILGVNLSNPGVDCLQDIHWAQGYFGYFQAYGLGLLFAAQIHTYLLKNHAMLFSQMKEGNFIPLLNWFKENIFQWGSFYNANQLIEQVTKTELQSQPFMDYLKQKYHF